MFGAVPCSYWCLEEKAEWFFWGGVCKPVRWLKVSIGQSSDKDLKEQRCMGEDGGFAICGHGDVEIKVLHPQLCTREQVRGF